MTALLEYYHQLMVVLSTYACYVYLKYLKSNCAYVTP